MQEKCNKSTEKLLEALYKNVSMARESIIYALPKVRSKELKDELIEQLDTYEKYCHEITAALTHLGNETKIKDFITKMMAMLEVKMSTLTDDSEAQIAQIIIESTTAGLTDIIREMREEENGCASESSISLAKKIASFEEKSVEKLKKHL